MTGRRAAAIVLGVSALVAAAAAAFVVHVRPGDLALVSWRGGGTPDLRLPGYSLRLPILQRLQDYPQGAVAVTATLTAASREGSTLDIPYTLKAWPDRQMLLSLHRDGGEGGATTAVRALFEEQLKKAAASTGTYELASGAADGSIVAFARRGLQEKVGSRLEISLGKPVLPPEVRASFERAAIYGQRVETGARVVLVGIDGADWDVIDALAARGRLPNLARLKAEGAWARLRSNVPTLSPLLWTTVATGKTPDRHGINDFLVIDPRTGRMVPINSTFRRAKAMWNILTEAGLSSDFIAWWATWPAESIQGHLISDRVAYSTFDLSGPKQGRGAVYPPEYASVVDTLRVSEASLSYPQVARFLHITPAEFERARAGASRRQGLSEMEQSIDVMTRVLAATETYRRIALDILARESSTGSPARLFSVYFEGVDEVNHRFAHCSPPQVPLCPDADYRRFKDAVDEFYVYQDGILGEILKAARGATVMVISDHGFASGGGRPKQVKPFIEGKPGLWHDLTGIFVLGGPLAGHGEIPMVTLFDIAPTILHLLGLAVPEDMPGKVLEAALAREFVAAHPVTRVPSYEGLEGPASAASAETDEATEQQIKEQLRALGYIGAGEETRPAPAVAPGESRGAPAASAGVPTVLFHTNLGAVYLSKKQSDEAEAEFQKALRIDPASTQALSGMAMVEEGRGNLDRALEYLQSVVRQESTSSYPTVIKIAELFIRMGKPLDGAAYLNGLKPDHGRGDAPELALNIGLGMLDSAAGRPADAEAALLRALAIDPNSVPAMQEIFALYDGQGRTAEMTPMIQAALRKNPHSAMHHIWLGLVLRRRDDLKGAEAEFKKAAEVAPDLVGALANLGSLYLQEGRLDDAVTVLQDALRKDARNPESRTNLIVALGMKRDPEGARRLVKDAEGMGQRVPLFYNALAYALHFNGHNQEALETLHESLRIDPRQPDALRLKSEIETGRQAGDLPYR
jgi:tetratricopeptide (TPR) repeat protein